MRIVLATPLYPPEIAEPAPYAKELAKRLSARHNVTIVAYTRLPEKVDGARIVVVNKRRPLLIRLTNFFVALAREAKNADVIYALNGASVEFPILLLSFFSRKPIIIGVGDESAHSRAEDNSFTRSIEHAAFARAKKIIAETPVARPEIIPFEPFPAEMMSRYEQSWNSHLRILEDAFNHAN